MGDGTGIFHSDYFSGWKQSELQYVLDNCETDSLSPGADSYCDNGPAGKQNGFNSDPRFLTFVDAPKRDHKADADIAAKIRPLVSGQIDTSHITREAIDGVSHLPGSLPTSTTTLRSTTKQPSTSTSTTTSTTTSSRPTTASSCLNFQGAFLPPWNDDSARITNWDAWCAVELSEGCEACRNSEGAQKYCKKSCAEIKCSGFSCSSPTTTTTSTRSPTTTSTTTSRLSTTQASCSNFQGAFLPPWNDDPARITNWNDWLLWKLVKAAK